VTPDDLKGMSDEQLAYCVISQLAVACATLANLFGRRPPGGRRYDAEDFLIRFKPKARSLHEAFELCRTWAADLPVVVEAEAKEQAKEVNG
jgi:hypothetical protein